jgi:phosphoribosylamine-glycine ligase
MRNILQKKMEGIPFSILSWWNGHSFVPPFEATIEYKKAHNGNLGPSTGCSMNLVWYYEQDKPAIVKAVHWEKLVPIFVKYNAPIGPYDINTIAADDGKAYFLEWTPRFGWDAEPTSTRLWDMDMTHFLEKFTQKRLDHIPVKRDLGYAVRLSVPPYPYEGCDDDKGSSLGTPIAGEDGLWDKHFIGYAVRANADADLEVAHRFGLVGLSLSTGPSLEHLHKQTLDYAKTLTIPGLSFRTDGLENIRRDAVRLRRAGFEMPGGIWK